MAPRFPICWRSESKHDRPPGAKLGSGSETTTRAKDGSAGRLRMNCSQAAAALRRKLNRARTPSINRGRTGASAYDQPGRG